MTTLGSRKAETQNAVPASSMKGKTSITLSGEVLAGIDRLAGSKHSRSAFIERVLRRYLRECARAAVQARDLERIDAASERLNTEAADVMEYQLQVPFDFAQVRLSSGLRPPRIARVARALLPAWSGVEQRASAPCPSHCPTSRKKRETWATRGGRLLP